MPMNTVCPECGAVLADGERFCPFCGARAVTVCPGCGNAEPSGSAFCGECGRVLEEVLERPKRQRRKPDRKKLVRTAAAVLAFALLTGAVGLIGGAGHPGRFLRGLGCYCAGDPVNAVMWLERVDSAWADGLTVGAAKMAYSKGVKAYRSGDRPSAASFFSVTGDIGDSELYRLMLSAQRFNYYINEASVSRIIDMVMEHWDFEDAPNALVSNQYVAETWLLGRWENSANGKYFSMDEDARIYFNLPVERNGDTYKVKLGTVYMYEEGQDEEDWIPVFGLYPMSGDSMSVFCYADGGYYNLSREAKE